jgi:DNA-binding NarL/FixJ family response regulator
MTIKYALIADDHDVTRRGVCEILRDAFEDIEVTEAADVPGVLGQLSARSWDLILLDVMMPGGSVLDVLAQIREKGHGAPVLVLTGVSEGEYVAQTIKAGANGFIHKKHAADVLVRAIHEVSKGGMYLDQESAVALGTSLRGAGSEQPHEKLSRRELQIFRMIALGLAVKEVAAELGLSDKTVATYLGRIREKTGLSSHVEIARYALQHSLVD